MSEKIIGQELSELLSKVNGKPNLNLFNTETGELKPLNEDEKSKDWPKLNLESGEVQICPNPVSESKGQFPPPHIVEKQLKDKKVN